MSLGLSRRLEAVEAKARTRGGFIYRTLTIVQEPGEPEEALRVRIAALEASFPAQDLSEGQRLVTFRTIYESRGHDAGSAR
jgi:hypothetical protein